MKTKQIKPVRANKEIRRRAREFLTYRLLALANDMAKTGAWIKNERIRHGSPGEGTETVQSLAALMVVQIVHEINNKEAK